MLLCERKTILRERGCRDQVRQVLDGTTGRTQRIPQRANATIWFPALVTTPGCPHHGEVCVLDDIGRSECRALKRTRTVQTSGTDA